MALWPLRGDRLSAAVAVPTGGANTSGASSGWSATATASATPHTKGPWTQVVASTSGDSYGLLVSLNLAVAANAAATSALLDIGVGAASSEVVVVPDLEVGYGIIGRTWRVPVFVPSGSRLAIRAQGLVASQAVTVVVAPQATLPGPRRPGGVTALGVNAATSRGVTVATSGTVNVKGTWAEIVASTAAPYSALMLGVAGNADTGLLAGSGLVDIGIGAAASEVVVVPNIHLTFGSSETMAVYDLGAWDVRVAAGSRVAVRAQVDNAGNSIDAIVYGIR